MDRTILHCDLNNFYASVEQKLRPELQGRPIAVCGDPKLRHGIVLAKNQIAKKAGVQTGEVLWTAKQKCPDIVFVPPHYDEYVKISKQVFNIYTQYTDRVESFGIDECWLDVTHSKNLFGDGKTIADTLRERIKTELGLTISVGVSFTKVLAKLGSDLKKPDATTVLDRDHYMQIIGDMSPANLIMIGRKTSEKLNLLNIKTIRDLSFADRNMLRSHFGVIGDNLIDAANGIDREEVKRYDERSLPKSVSNGTTTPRDLTSSDDIKSVVYALSETVAARLRQYGLVASGISLSIKSTSLKWTGKQTSLPRPTMAATVIAENALLMLPSLNPTSAPIRAITIGAIRLSESNSLNASIFDCEYEKEEVVEKSVDKIRGKYGYNALKRGVTLNSDLVDNLHDDDDFRPFHQSKDS